MDSSKIKSFENSVRKMIRKKTIINFLSFLLTVNLALRGPQNGFIIGNKINAASFTFNSTPERGK
jgi:hypothetical protein